MPFVLGPGARDSGFRLATHETIGSTSVEALSLARAGDPGAVWVVSSHQTAGRGRRGKRWSTEPGNLAASILVIAEAKPEVAATLGFVAGLSLDKALQTAAPNLRLAVALDGVEGEGARVRLKWPNDVLIDGDKIAGILLEAERLPDDRLAVAIGIGVNVVSSPSDLPYPAASLQELGVSAHAPDVFAPLSDAWAEFVQVWDHGNGFGTIRALWLERAAGLGGEIAVRVGQEVFTGVFKTIDDQGRLLVRAPDGSERAISSGEVHFGAAATAR